MARKKNDFLDQYKDPRWQKKRLEIMQRDEFCCASCGDNETTLNVHHQVPYKKDTPIWAYENEELVTLCESCHKELSEIIDKCRSIVIGRCWCIDAALETSRILSEIDGMNPFELQAVWKLIKEAKKLH